MPFVEIYTKSYCGYCWRAKELLNRKGIAFTEIDVTSDRAGQEEMRRRSGGFTVPQVFIDGRAVGGSDELAMLEASGELESQLAVASGT